MNLAYVHTGLWPSDSPSTTFTTRTALALAAERNRVWLFNKRNHSTTAEEVLQDLFGAETPEGLEIRSLEWHLRFTNRLYYRRIVRRLKGIHGEYGLDAVISRNVTFLPHLVRLGADLGIPTLFESHDFYADLSQREDAGGGARRRQRLELRWLPRVSCLVCLQEGQRRLYSTVFPDLRTEVVRTGAGPPIHRSGPGSFVTYVGSLDHRKGVELLLRAAQLSESRPPLLIIGGRNDGEIDSVREAASRLAPEVDVRLTGWVGKTELSELLGKTAIGVLPLRDTFFNRHVTSPLKLFDYLSHGVPVIAADLPALRELLSEAGTGLFYPAGDAEALAKRIDELWQDPGRRTSMADGIFQEGRRFSWKARAVRLTEIVRKLRDGR